MKERLLERDIEAALHEHVKANGGTTYKFTSPARRNVPDRLVILRPIPPDLQPLIARYIRFAELKRPGEKPTGGQEREHERLRRFGLRVDVIDSMEFPR